MLKPNQESRPMPTALKVVAACAVAVVGSIAFIDAQTPKAAPKTASPSPAAPAATIARGKYLVDTGGCHDCHTPKKMGANGMEPETAKLLAGHVDTPPLPPPPKLPEGPWVAVAAGDLTAWSGPWGISYAMNLTPDAETGLGGWTEPMFVSTIRNGKHMGTGRPILPPMPWQTLRNLTDDDLKAIFAYLRTVPAVKNRVPLPVPPGK